MKVAVGELYILGSVCVADIFTYILRPHFEVGRSPLTDYGFCPHLLGVSAEMRLNGPIITSSHLIIQTSHKQPL